MERPCLGPQCSSTCSHILDQHAKSTASEPKDKKRTSQCRSAHNKCLDKLYMLNSFIFNLNRTMTVMTTIVYLRVDSAKTIEIKKQEFWHSIQISLNYICKDFQFGTWLQNRLHRASIFPLAGNPEISSTTLKTFCSQSIKCYSHSHWRQDNNYQLSAFHWTETYWCKNRSGSVLLMWLSLSHQHAPLSKLLSKVGIVWIEYSNFV